MLDGDGPFGIANGSMAASIALTNEWWIKLGLMDKTIDAAAGIDCSLMGDLVASGYRQSLTAHWHKTRERLRAPVPSNHRAWLCPPAVQITFSGSAFAPGTGTPEVGGPNSYQAIQVARMLDGVNIVGADLVEVSPPFDTSGATAVLGVSVMFEILCNIALRISR